MFLVYIYEVFITQQVKILNFDYQNLLQLSISIVQRLLHVIELTKLRAVCKTEYDTKSRRRTLDAAKK